MQGALPKSHERVWVGELDNSSLDNSSPVFPQP